MVKKELTPLSGATKTLDAAGELQAIVGSIVLKLCSAAALY
jgi:hypothetical protein